MRIQNATWKMSKPKTTPFRTRKLKTKFLWRRKKNRKKHTFSKTRVFDYFWCELPYFDRAVTNNKRKNFEVENFFKRFYLFIFCPEKKIPLRGDPPPPSPDQKSTVKWLSRVIGGSRKNRRLKKIKESKDQLWALFPHGICSWWKIINY